VLRKIHIVSPRVKKTLWDGRVPAKVVGQFTQLRQQCCHPQIVRRDVWLGKTRLSMRQILTRLVTRAFGEYDAALRAEYNARLLLAAVQHEHELCRANAGGESSQQAWHCKLVIPLQEPFGRQCAILVVGFSNYLSCCAMCVEAHSRTEAYNCLQH
jgi:hypothetical protein